MSYAVVMVTIPKTGLNSMRRPLGGSPRRFKNRYPGKINTIARSKIAETEPEKLLDRTSGTESNMRMSSKTRTSAEGLTRRALCSIGIKETTSKKGGLTINAGQLLCLMRQRQSSEDRPARRRPYALAHFGRTQ